MKYIFIAVALFISGLAIGQQVNLVVKAQKQSLSVDLNADNTGRTIVLNSRSRTRAADKLVVYQPNNATEKEWKRSFIIFDNNDAEIVKLSNGQGKRFYEVGLQKLFTLLKKDNDYYLHTMAVPTDPKRAATVRVRRVLVCKIVSK